MILHLWFLFPSRIFRGSLNQYLSCAFLTIAYWAQNSKLSTTKNIVVNKRCDLRNIVNLNSKRLRMRLLSHVRLRFTEKRTYTYPSLCESEYVLFTLTQRTAQGTSKESLHLNFFIYSLSKWTDVQGVPGSTGTFPRWASSIRFSMAPPVRSEASRSPTSNPLKCWKEYKFINERIILFVLSSEMCTTLATLWTPTLCIYPRSMHLIFQLSVDSEGMLPIDAHCTVVHTLLWQFLNI